MHESENGIECCKALYSRYYVITVLTELTTGVNYLNKTGPINILLPRGEGLVRHLTVARGDRDMVFSGAASAKFHMLL